MITRFSCPVDQKILRSTNAIWNDLRLNQPWSIGRVSGLIKSQNFNTYQDWISAYYQSGTERQAQLSTLAKATRQGLKDPTLSYGDQEGLADYSHLQFDYGRTPFELLQRAYMLRQAVTQKSKELSLDQCYQIVKYRVLGETWNGIYLREHHVCEQIQNLYKEIEIDRSTAEEDYRYAIDIIIRQYGQNQVAIQIKPLSYRGDAPYLAKAKKANSKKQAAYTERYDVPVITIHADEDGASDDYQILSDYL